MEDYQALCRQLESVECSIPTVGLVEETEERLVERIGLYQVRDNIQTAHTCGISASICIHTISDCSQTLPESYNCAYLFKYLSYYK